MPFFLLGLLAVGGLLAFSGGKKTGPGSVDTANIPAALVAQINASLTTGDPAVMRKVAGTVRSAGFPAAASSLEDAARTTEAAMNAVPPTRAGVNIAPKADSQEARDLAGKLAGVLSGQSVADARNSAAVKALVTAYQQQEKKRGFYVGNIDGLFGPKSALTLAKDHGIVPPHPLYWPKKDAAAAKRSYKASLAPYVAADSQRAEEWAQAMNVDAD